MGVLLSWATFLRRQVLEPVTKTLIWLSSRGCDKAVEPVLLRGNRLQAVCGFINGSHPITLDRTLDDHKEANLQPRGLSELSPPALM